MLSSAFSYPSAGKHSSTTELTTALAPRLRVFRGQHALMSCGQNTSICTLPGAFVAANHRHVRRSMQRQMPTVVGRFCSWTPDKGSEQVDAFASRSWDNSSCLGCKRWHRECGFYHVPDGLADTVVRRARSNGARGLFLVPTNFKAGYFIALRAVAIAVLELETNQSLYRLTSKPVGRMTLCCRLR